MMLANLKACPPDNRIEILESDRDVLVGPVLLVIVKGHFVHAEF